MGRHTFKKAPHLQVPLSEEEKRAIAKKLQRDPNVRSFDSSIAYSLPRIAGFTPKTLRLELIDRNDRRDTYNVYGANLSDDGQTEWKDSWRGTLTVETDEEWRRRMGTGR